MLFRSSGFSADWLSLREPADIAARSSALVDFVAGACQGGGHALDLGGGTGANVRFLASRLPLIRWTLVDDDPHLLSRVPEGVTACRADLNVVLEDDALFAGCVLVTASALLDLVSDAWLGRLVARCRASGAAVLFALSYDGRIVCEPGDPDDRAVRDLVNALRDPHRRQQPVGQAHADAPGLRHGHQVDEHEEERRLVHRLPGLPDNQRGSVRAAASAPSPNRLLRRSDSGHADGHSNHDYLGRHVLR